MIIGVVLPIAETYRRYGTASDWFLIFDDYLAGTLLFIGAWILLSKGNVKPLIAAWGLALGGFYYSVFSSLTDWISGVGDISGMPMSLILGMKFGIVLIGITCLLVLILGKDQKK